MTKGGLPKESDLDERDSPIIVSAARRRKRPGATSRTVKLEVAQLENYQRDTAPRHAEVEALLWRCTPRTRAC